VNTNQFVSGRVAIVTGGNKGIGKEIALALAEAGADVAIGARSAATSHSRASFSGTRVLAINVDVRSTESVQHFYEAVVNAFGQVDILIN
jgi:NAD(P)-dependent dehydrogenase (short-subunit alcohol dehydrogenase family)